jgi:hypothetical protein
LPLRVPGEILIFRIADLPNVLTRGCLLGVVVD